tara:strand:- start:198 stop:431 length:234 start_codon:yes stop_codon:yes gene_type:complete
MNFKLTRWKTILSILIGIILGIYFSKVQYIGGPGGPPYVFSLSSVVGFIIGFVVVYTIWSLIQKRVILESSETIRQK